MSYNLVLPTSTDPRALGWTQNDRVVFKINNPGQALRKGTLRFNGLLTIFRTVNGVSSKVDSTDQIRLNPNAGVSGLIYQASTRFNGASVETINNYGRILALKNEAKFYQMDNATSTNSMLQLMTYSNDAYATGDDLKINILQGLKYPSVANTSELPFSIDLDICVNSSTVNIPFTRTGEIEISLILQDITKSGITALGNIPNATYSYYMKNIEMRYITDELTADDKGAIVLEIKNEAHVPTILNKTSALEFASTNAFDSVVCSFLKQGHDSTNASLAYDWLASEAITEQIEYLEVKVNGRDDFLKYPLRFNTTEVIYNYLLAWSPYIHIYDDLTVNRHGLTYTKLGNTLPTGFGMGCHLYGGLDAGTRLSFNLTLKSPPITPYRAFIVTLGKLLL